MKRRVNGNITVYMGMVIGIILTLVFSLLEVVHFHCLGQEKDLLSQVGAESVWAAYNQPLWSDYGILAMDAGYCSASFEKKPVEQYAMDYVQKNSQNSLLSLVVTGVDLSTYTLLSDQSGRAFLKEAAIAELYGLPEGVLDSQNQLCQQMETDATGVASMEDVLMNAQNSLEEAEEIRMSQAVESDVTESAAVQEAPETPPENPILTIQEWKVKGVLAQVIPAKETLSGGLLGENRPSNRVLQQGNEVVSPLGVADRVLYGLYLKDHLQNYTRSLGHDGLAYEWEYVLNGKASDEENLKLTVEKLLALREVQNYVAIQRIDACVISAETTATALVGFTGNPMIIQGVKQGILASWAYMESVLDVRALLHGKKIPLCKTSESWTSDITNIAACLSIENQAKEDANGISYEAYLVALTYLATEQQVGMRCLDVMEAALRNHPGYEACHIDNMLVKGNFTFSYEGYPTFASMVPSLHNRIGGYSFQRQWEISYYT